jgi:uncharacterized membrane protein SirB2
MSYEFYKVLHLFGILTLFCGLGASAMLSLRGGSEDETKPLRKYLGMIHGVAALVIFVAGFGLMARTGIVQGGAWPTWIYVKVMIWLLLGGALVLVRKQPAMGRLWVVALPVIGALAAYFAVGKPG